MGSPAFTHAANSDTTALSRSRVILRSLGSGGIDANDDRGENPESDMIIE